MSSYVKYFCEMLGNPVQDFCSILVGKSCGLLTGYRNRRYGLLRSRGRLLSVLYSLLTLWKFLIARGCVLFVWLGDWAGRLQGFPYSSSLANINYRKLNSSQSWSQYCLKVFKFDWLVLQPKFYIFIVGFSNKEVIQWRIWPLQSHSAKMSITNYCDRLSQLSEHPDYRL